MLATLGPVAGAGEKHGRDTGFTGRVIDAGGNYVELKRGPREIRLTYTDTTKFFGLDGAEADGSAIEICQVVRAVYQPVDRAGKLVSITVLKEGNCRK